MVKPVPVVDEPVYQVARCRVGRWWNIKVSPGIPPRYLCIPRWETGHSIKCTRKLEAISQDKEQSFPRTKGLVQFREFELSFSAGFPLISNEDFVSCFQTQVAFGRPFDPFTSVSIFVDLFKQFLKDSMQEDTWAPPGSALGTYRLRVFFCQKNHVFCRQSHFSGFDRALID